VRSPLVRILLAVIGGFAVVAISFIVTLEILDYWDTPADPQASVIHVVEGTYGINCKDFVPQAPHVNLVKAGNATAVLAQACDNAKASCLFTVDVTKLGDPANGCGKDFNASWRCGNAEEIHKVFLPAEASGREAPFTCPAP
jgi:hypothetical protein